MLDEEINYVLYLNNDLHKKSKIWPK